uniref:hypothetical protein n=1 Tax=Candidatus Scatocola faecigallinarum TaxID=2840916 RepID=UPI004025B9E0
KPISDIPASLKLASICFLGVGDCDPNAGFGTGDDYSMDTVQQCLNEGYTKLNCNSVQTVDGVCPYNPAYGLGCKCVSNLVSCPAGQTGVGESCGGKYVSCECDPALVSCASNQVGQGASCGGKYESCACRPEYKYTSSNCSYPRSVSGDSCGGQYTDCVCPSGVNEGQYGCEEYYPAPCETVCKKAYADNCHNRTDNNSQTYGCMKYYDDCSTKCETPYKDNCRNRTEISLPANGQCAAYFSDCSAKCSEWTCKSGYEKNGNVCKQSCDAKFVYDSSNCSGEGMLLSGESCDGKYAVCKKFAKILYSDRSVSYEDIPAKTPIGIVVDEKKKIAVSLTYDSRVYNDWQSIPHKYPQSWEDLTFYDIPAIENCDNLQIFDMKAGWIDNPKCLNRDGKSETAKIAAYAKSSGITHLATDVVLSYVPPQVSSPASWFAKGQWYLASIEDFITISRNYDAIKNTFEKLESSRASIIDISDLKYVGWYASTECDVKRVWVMNCSDECRMHCQPKTASPMTDTSSSRAFISY